MTGRLLWLPAALKNAGLEVDAVAGWEKRGKLGMRPSVVVLHHTAAPMGRNAPSLNVVVHGRSDLPGPLCHVLIGRDGTCHVIAAGVANHAGTGGWQGITGNSRAIGIEVENVGTPAEPWTPDLVDVMVRAARACATEAGIPTSMVCGHKEWAPRRKIDPHTLSMRTVRALIAATPTPSEEDDMPYTRDELKTVVREVLNEGTGKGQKNWAGTSKATLASIQGVRNVVNAIQGDTEALQAELGEALAAEGVAASAAQVEAVVRKVFADAADGG